MLAKSQRPQLTVSTRCQDPHSAKQLLPRTYFVGAQSNPNGARVWLHGNPWRAACRRFEPCCQLVAPIGPGIIPALFGVMRDQLYPHVL